VRCMKIETEVVTKMTQNFVSSKIGALVLFVLAAACSPKKQEPTAGAKPKIGFILSTMQEERYAKDKKYFEQRAAELGAEVVFASANNNEQEQLSKVENILSQGVKVLVVQPVNSRAASSFVTMAHKDGVKVVAYDRVIYNAPVDLYVTQDSYRVGVLQAEAAASFTKGKGNYIVLQGESGHSVAKEITRGVLDTLAKFPEIKVVVNQAHAGWSGELAMKTVENALTANKDNVAAILANNSGMANGAVQALVEQKLVGKVFVAGADADLTAIKNVVAGRQQFEVLKSIEPLAEAAASAAVALAKGELPRSDLVLDFEGQKVPVINTPVYAITKDNVEEKIVSTGFHPRDAVFGK
jgi:D-xylose transport system substrate-binding protein